MKTALTVLSAACVFLLGCYAAAEWPRLSAQADCLLQPIYAFLEAPALAEARLVHVRSLESARASDRQQLDAQAREIQETLAREQVLADALATARCERDQALSDARQAAGRYAALCQAIRSLELDNAVRAAAGQE